MLAQQLQLAQQHQHLVDLAQDPQQQHRLWEDLVLRPPQQQQQLLPPWGDLAPPLLSPLQQLPHLWEGLVLELRPHQPQPQSLALAATRQGEAF